MVASAVYILDLKGKVIISRRYRDDCPDSVVDDFTKYLSEIEDSELLPVVPIGDVTFIHVKHSDLILLAVTKKNANVSMVLLLLYRLTKILSEYFQELNEESLRDNFVLTYELLDEVVDFGYPQATESTVLKQYITQEGHKLLEDPKPKRPPLAVTGAVSWRAEGLRHKRNEVFLDVVEQVNLLVSGSGTLLRSEVLGSLNLRTFLSGMPELKLGLNDKLRIQTQRVASRGRTVDLEDVKFHQCVQLHRFDTDRTISFIPPDGECKLMSYRLNTQVKPLIWVEVIEPHEKYRTKRELVVKAKSQFKRRSTAQNVEITIPIPPDADTPKFKPAAGTARYVPEKDAIVWTLKQFQGGYETVLRASFGLPSVRQEDGDSAGKAPISVKFEVPFFTVSGILVRYLKVHEKSGYDALCWVRYITKSGDYQLRR